MKLAFIVSNVLISFAVGVAGGVVTFVALRDNCSLLDMALSSVVEETALTPTVPAPAGSSKVNRDNFRKITEGMTLAQVEAILGKGEKTSESEFSDREITEWYQWEHPSNGDYISLSLTNGIVDFKLYSKGN